MINRIAVVTGANSGIGKITAQALLAEGYHVVMICRNPGKAEKAREDIMAEAGSEKADILICDLSEMKQVYKTAEIIRQNYKRLDILVNNAGFISDGGRKESPEGIELTFAVNHLAYFLLAKELLPLLKVTPQSRIINVASNAHRYGRFEPNNLQLTNNYNAKRAYGNSKLFNIMFTHHLNKKLKGHDITTYSLHPGVVNTNFASGSDSWFAKLFQLGRSFMLSPEQGAKTVIYLCTAPEIEKHSGKYFYKSRPVKPRKKEAMDDEACRELWEISEKITQEILQK